MQPEQSLEERVLSTSRIYEGKIVKLRVDTVELGEGKQSRREIIEHEDAVVVVPVDALGNVLMVRQYRLAAGRVLLEAPAGLLDGGEDIKAGAGRELREETGHGARTIRRLGGFYVSPGYSTEYIHAFLATDLFEAEGQADEDERIIVERMPLSEAVRLAEAGLIEDAKSIVALLLAAKALGAE